MPAESTPTTCPTCRYTRLAPKSFNVIEVKLRWISSIALDYGGRLLQMESAGERNWGSRGVNDAIQHLGVAGTLVTRSLRLAPFFRMQFN
jgi:hypothetical protein